IRKRICELIEMSSEFQNLVYQFRYMPAVVYFTISAAIEFNLFLTICPSTKPILRFIAICNTHFFVFFFLLALIMMAEVNARSKLILPELNHCLFRFHQSTFKNRLFLAETQYLIASDKISYNMAHIFNMTRLNFLLSVFSIVQTVKIG